MADPVPDSRDDIVREEIVPFLGERAVTMFAFAVADGVPSPTVAAPYRREIEEAGDDPLDPQVTEAEHLLIDWGRRLGAEATADPELDHRVADTFQPRLRQLLQEYAALIVERCGAPGSR